MTLIGECIISRSTSASREYNGMFLEQNRRRRGIPPAPELIHSESVRFYCETGGGGGAVGGFRCRAFGGAGAPPGGTGVFGTTGADGKAGPFLIRTSPLLELNT